MEVELHEKQSVAFNTKATELLYGGAAGGGKSYLLRVSLARWCMVVPGLQAYLFRRTFPDLKRNHLRGPKNLHTLLADHTASGHVVWRAGDSEFVFWNGSVLKLAHCQYERDVEKYQGAEFHILGIDELTHFTSYQYNYLRSRVRIAGIEIPDRYKDLLPRIECGSNPGSVGHAWVKRTFKPMVSPMELRRAPVSEGGMLRQYIPAKLKDNPTLMKDDPTYIHRLEGLGSPALVKAMKDGDWNIVAGQAFENLSYDIHGIEPFRIPVHWLRFRSLDWGSSKPFSVGWWAVSDGTDKRFPRGALIRYREWYGWNGQPNEGCRMESNEVAEGILKREETEKGREKIGFSVADPTIFNKNDGPSTAEKMAREGVIFKRGDPSRHLGYLQVRERIKGEDDRPLIYIFNTCKHFWRTIPDLIMDEHDTEDVDTSQEDHVYDEVKIACMARPWVLKAKKDKPPVDRWDRVFAQGNDGEGTSWRSRVG